MTFMVREGWHVQFFEPEVQTPLPSEFTFAGPNKFGT
jgi:hypothetical protein